MPRILQRGAAKNALVIPQRFQKSGFVCSDDSVISGRGSRRSRLKHGRRGDGGCCLCVESGIVGNGCDSRTH